MPRYPPCSPRIPYGIRGLVVVGLVLAAMLSARSASAQVPMPYGYGPMPWGYAGAYYPGYGWPIGSGYGVLTHQGRTVYGFGRFSGQGRTATGMYISRPGFAYGTGTVYGRRGVHAGTFVRTPRYTMFWGH